MRWLAIVLAAGCGSSHSGTVDSAGSGAIDGPGTGGDGSNSGSDGGTDGSTGTCPQGTWCTETSPSGSTRLTGVWALDAGDVFAVGDGGTILRRDASSWSKMTSNVTANLHGVWAHDASNAWAVGDGGAIVRWNGTSWTPITGVTTVDLAAVWGSSVSDVWIVGPNTVLHYDGASWGTTGLGGILLSVTGTSASDVWVCGETAYVRHYTGSWSSPISPVNGNSTYYAIAASSSAVWATSASSNAETAVYGGSSWTPHGTSSIVFEGLYAGDSGSVWGVAQTKVGHWNGTSWDVAQPTGVTAALWGVSGAGADVFVVGDGGKILHRD